jgi:hypothetical protein
MQIPEHFKDWTLARITGLLKAGVCECDTFDFKERLPDSKNFDGKHRLRKTIAAFANSGGGFLIYGIKDDRSLATQDRLIGIDVVADFPREFGVFPTGCQPSVEWSQRATPIKLPGGKSVLHVFEIHSNWRKPHAVMRDGAAYFMKRTNKGDEEMSFAEIAGAFRESEFRRTGLALLISELDHTRSTAKQLVEASQRTSNIEAHPDKPWTWATRYSTTLLDVTLGNVFPFLTSDPDLWKLLCTIRENARSSNATSEGFTTAVFFRLPQRVLISDSNVRELINCARAIVTASENAEERLKKLQQ